MSTYKPEPGHGPAPNMPPSVMHAAKLPPKVTDKYVFFFGFEGPEPENCFQQWYPSSFNDPHDKLQPGATFPTTEHYMMYHKALLMGDSEIAEKIRKSDTPAQAKTFGREVRNFKQETWDANCDAVVERGNLLKFSQNEKCKEALLGTGDREIIEASPNDSIWGIGFNAEEAEGRESEWGTNKLGKALERVRATLRSGVNGN